MLLAQFLLVCLGSMLLWWAVLFEPKEFLPDRRVYLAASADTRNPLQPTRILSPGRARKRGHFYIAYLDARARVSYLEYWERGERVGKAWFTYPGQGRAPWVRVEGKLRPAPGT